jgi:uncharacterized protein YgiM (DUF1202 family)
MGKIARSQFVMAAELIMLGITAPAYAVDSESVTTTDVNVRVCAGTNCKITTTLKTGTPVTVIGTDTGWSKEKQSNVSWSQIDKPNGYIRTDLLKPITNEIPNKESTITTESQESKLLKTHEYFRNALKPPVQIDIPDFTPHYKTAPMYGAG